MWFLEFFASDHRSTSTRGQIQMAASGRNDGTYEPSDENGHKQWLLFSFKAGRQRARIEKRRSYPRPPAFLAFSLIRTSSQSRSQVRFSTGILTFGFCFLIQF